MLILLVSLNNQAYSQEPFPSDLLFCSGKPRVNPWRWCPNDQGEIVLSYSFGVGLNNFQQEYYRTIIKSAVEDWNNFILLDLFGGAFRLKFVGDGGFDPNEDCPNDCKSLNESGLKENKVKL